MEEFRYGNYCNNFWHLEKYQNTKPKNKKVKNWNSDSNFVKNFHIENRISPDMYGFKLRLTGWFLELSRKQIHEHSSSLGIYKYN